MLNLFLSLVEPTYPTSLFYVLILSFYMPAASPPVYVTWSILSCLVSPASTSPEMCSRGLTSCLISIVSRIFVLSPLEIRPIQMSQVCLFLLEISVITC